VPHPINWNIFTETWGNIAFIHANRTVFLSVLGISWFWFLGATYLVQLPNYTRLTLGGNEQVVLCERGIRTFEDSIRFSLDISSIPVIKSVSHLPVIVDPSHATGHYSLVPAVAKAAVAAGADGLLIEVHPNPKEALVDGLQSLTPSDFARLMGELRAIAKSVDRYI